MSTRDDMSVRIVRRRMRRVGAVLALLPFLFRVSIRLGPGPLPTWLIVWIALTSACLGIGLLLLALSWLLGRGRHRLAVRDGRLWLDGKSLCELEAIRDVLILAPQQVRLSLPTGSLVVGATEKTSVRDVVDRLPHVIARSSHWGRMRTTPLSSLKMPRFVRIEVGADGIVLRGMRRKRFIPRAQIATVSRLMEKDRRGSILVTFRGDAQAIELVAMADDDGLEAELRRLLEPVAAGDSGETYGLLERGHRPASEWITSLRKLLRPDSAYRGSITPEWLREVAEDSAAPPSARAGAFLALRLAAQTAPRIRDEQVSPLMRVALEASDEELASQLEREAEEDERTAKR